MDDLISRQNAIELIKNYCENGCDIAEDNWCPSCQREQFIELLKALPSAQQWIPCSEKPPHTNGVYNVTRKISDGFECRNISDACYYDGANTWHDDTRVNHERMYLTDVIAWMSLPEPYKAESEDKE